MRSCVLKKKIFLQPKQQQQFGCVYFYAAVFVSGKPKILCVKLAAIMTCTQHTTTTTRTAMQERLRLRRRVENE